MHLIGYIASILIGVSLGLIGGGGSILTVPVLVYLFQIDAVLATTYSLFIVGTTSAVGSYSYFKKGLVNIKTAMIFGLPSILSVFLVRHYLLPAIPNTVLTLSGYTITKDMFLLLVFSILMLLASYRMIKGRYNVSDNIDMDLSLKYPVIFVVGIVVGALTGLVGAGGGFLIIPALVSLLRLPMKNAVGTSLLIIAINSLMGFLFSIAHTVIQWQFLIIIAVIAIIGILIGSFMATKIEGNKLKPAFGWFVLVMGIYIILKETIMK